MNWSAWALWRAQLELGRARVSGNTDEVQAARRWVHLAFVDCYFTSSSTIPLRKHRLGALRPGTAAQQLPTRTA